jgi:hypothetical protein
MRRQRPTAGGRPLAAAAAAAVLLALAGVGRVAAQQQAEWTVVTDPFATKLPGLEVAVAGPPQQPFARPPPRTLDPHLLTDFATQLNVLQDFSGEGDNAFTDTSLQYVATVHNAFVEGEGGLVYDAAGRAYHLPHQFFTRTGALPPMPTHTPAQVRGGLCALPSRGRRVAGWVHRRRQSCETSLGFRCHTARSPPADAASHPPAAAGRRRL